MYKSNAKNEAKRLRATNIDSAKFEVCTYFAFNYVIRSMCQE